MKKIFKGILKGIENSFERFPLTIGVSTTCVVLLIYMLEITSQSNSDVIETIGRVTMAIALGIPLSLSIKLYFERLGNYKAVSLYASYILGGVLLVVYYYLFLNYIEMVSMTRYTGFSLILYLVFLFISYLPKRDDFEFYVIRIFTKFFTTVLYSLVLYIGLAAILFTIDKLLGINIKGELYYYTFLVVAGIFAPAFFLAGIPTKNETLTLNDYSRLLNVLVLYIIMPLLSVYTIILYIYFAKIIITSQWPEGLVSNLVLWYSAISAAVLFFISPLLKEKIWPREYMKYFPKVILPLVVMMFISIGIRIKAYGVTENRYFVVALAIWVLLVMIYFTISKKLINIILPISLAVITTIAVFGPVSSYSIAKYSQNKRLNKIFAKNNMILNNKVVKAKAEVSKEDISQISSVLNYFDRNYSLSDINSLPKDFKISDSEKVLGVKYSEGNYESNNEYFNFNSAGISEAMDVRGYDYLFDSRYNKFQNLNSTPISINYDYEISTLKITEDGKNIYKKDLMDFVNILIEKYNINQSQKNISQEEMTFKDGNDKVVIKIIFSNISGNKNASTEKFQSKNLEFYILVKLK